MSDDDDAERMVTDLITSIYTENVAEQWILLSKLRKKGYNDEHHDIGFCLQTILDLVPKLCTHYKFIGMNTIEMKSRLFWNIFPYSYRIGSCNYILLDGLYGIIIPPLFDLKQIDMSEIRTRNVLSGALHNVPLFYVKQWYTFYVQYHTSCTPQFHESDEFRLLQELLSSLNDARFGDVIDVFPLMGFGTYILGFGATDLETISHAYKANTVDKYLKFIKTFTYMDLDAALTADIVELEDHFCSCIPVEFSDAPFHYFFNTNLNYKESTFSTYERRIIDPLRINNKGVIWKKIAHFIADHNTSNTIIFPDDAIAILDYQEKIRWVPRTKVRLQNKYVANSLKSYAQRYDEAVAQKRNDLIEFIKAECGCDLFTDKIRLCVVDFVISVPRDQHNGFLSSVQNDAVKRIVTIDGCTVCCRDGCSGIGNTICIQCYKNKYCSRKCQKIDWNFRHRYQCQYIMFL
eukprot:15236_1